MALKRRNKVDAAFSMASMTDIIFLLLLFFVISSTMTTPNDISVNLPESSANKSTKQIVARISIDKTGNYFLATGDQEVQPISVEQLEPQILQVVSQDTANTYIALYADQDIAYKQVVKVLDIANKNKLKLVIATKSSPNTEKE